MGSEHYCLRWNNHQSNLLGVFSQLLRDERLVDVTLACSEGHSIRAHKVVLSACSSYFQSLFVDHPSRHPIVILKDVRFSELRTLIDFMYKGEVNVEYCQLSALLKTAESLKVKGLAEMTRDCKNDSEEQTEPTELVTRKPQQHLIQTLVQENENENLSRRSSPTIMRKDNSPSRLENVENNTNSNDGFRGGSASPPNNNSMCVVEEEPNDMTIQNNSSVSAAVSSSHLGRLSPSIPSELPGTSNLPPVQQVPLSLKKEVDWGGGSEEKDGKEPDLPSSLRSHQEQQESLNSSMDKPSSSTQSSRSSTPFTIPPFPSFTSSLLEMSLLHSGLLNEELFRCSSCMAAFPSVWLLEQHNALQHLGAIGSIDKPFICEQCGQSYRYRSAYVKHREQNHRARLPADKLFSCDVCGMQFRYLKSFKKHRLNHALEKLHGKTNNVDQTSTATARIPNNNESNKIDKLDAEKQQVEPVEKSNKLYDNSSEVSSSNEIINSLKQEEENEEPVVVKIENTAEEKDSANDGQLSDAEVEKTDSEEQDNTVDSIGPLRSTFNQPILDFYRGMGENLNRQRDRKFACPFCGKCVRSKENLKLHVRKHTGERPFVCLFCGRAFGGKSDLTRHLRIHTGERPYHCDMCGKCFARADYLSKHLTTHINTPR